MPAKDSAARLLASPAAQKAALVVLCVVLAILLQQTYRVALRPSGNDYTSYLLSARALVDGADPYQTSTPFPYVYPLFLALVLVPLAIVPYTVSVLVWWASSVLSLALSIRMSLSLEGAVAGSGRGAERLRPSLVLLFLAFFSPIQNNLLNGQVNLHVLSLMTGFGFALARGGWILAALLLAIGIATKLLPLALIAFLMVRRRLGTALLSLCFALVLSVSPYALVGERLWVYYGSYWDTFLSKHLLRSSSQPEAGFFSLRDFLCYVFPSLGERAWIEPAAAAAVMASIAVADWLSRRRASGVGFWSLSLYFVGIPLMSPILELHHLVYVAPVAIVLTLAVALDSKRAHKLAVAGLVLFWVLMWLAPLDRGGPWYFFSLVALLGTLLWRVATQDRERPSSLRGRA